MSVGSTSTPGPSGPATDMKRRPVSIDRAVCTTVWSSAAHCSVLKGACSRCK
jgi:hypothetical protein